jgi:hypothetical protein
MRLNERAREREVPVELLKFQLAVVVFHGRKIRIYTPAESTSAAVAATTKPALTFRLVFMHLVLRFVCANIPSANTLLYQTDARSHRRVALL